MDRNLYAYLESLQCQNLRLKTIYQKHNLLMRYSKVSTKEELLNTVLSWSNLSSSTRKNYCGTFREYFKFLGQTELVKYVPKVKREIRLVKDIPTQKQFIETLKNLKPCDEKSAVYFLYSTGMRIGELLNLSIYDVDLMKKEIRITKAKSRQERIIPLPKSLIFYYKHLIHSKLNLFSLNQWKLYNYIKKELNINPHHIRHIYAVHMLENGADINHLSRLLGHKDIRSTCLYARYVNKAFTLKYQQYFPRGERYES
jgi:integrase/recombinase XerD